MLQQTFILFYFIAAPSQSLSKKWTGYMLIITIFMHDMTDHTIRRRNISTATILFHEYYNRQTNEQISDHCFRISTNRAADKMRGDNTI